MTLHASTLTLYHVQSLIAAQAKPTYSKKPDELIEQQA